MGNTSEQQKDCYMCTHVLDDRKSNSLICMSDNIDHRMKFIEEGRYYAEKCRGFSNISTENKRIINNNVALRFVLAGKCEFTMVSGKTGAKIEYKLQKKASTKAGLEFIYFLNTKIGSDYVYCGILSYDESVGEFKFFKGQKGRLDNEHINVKSLLFVLNNLNKGITNLNIRIYHVGKCGRCSKKLTTPESIMTGLGPECSKKCGVPRVRVSKKDFN